MLNARAPIPLYHQLAQMLEAEIDAGRYPVGHKIPSEHELAERFRIGRPTVRQATELLVRRNLLERRRGSGTFVREPAPQVDLFSLGGTAASFEKEGLVLTTQLLSDVSRVASQGLQNKPAWRVARLGSVDSKPVVLETLDFDCERFADIKSHLTRSGSLSRLVQERYHLRATKAHQSFQVGRPNLSEASVLQISRRKCVLFVERRLHFEGAGHLVHSRLCCPTDTIHFSQEIIAND